MKTRSRLILTIAICLTLVSLVAVFAACGKDALVSGGDFEFAEFASSPWALSENASNNVTVVSNGNDDATVNNGTAHSIRLTASSSWNYIHQKVRLTSGKYYKLSVRVKIDTLTPGGSSDNEVGFVVGFLEGKNFSGLNITGNKQIREQWGNPSGNRWVECYVYFKSTASTEFTLFAGIGNATEKASGTVYFDDINISEQSSAVAGEAHYIGMLKDGNTYSLAGAASYVYVVLLALFTIVVAYAAVLAIRYALRRDAQEPLYSETTPDADGEDKPVAQASSTKTGKKSVFTSPLALFTYAMAAALIIRFIVVVTTFGFGKLTQDYYNLFTSVNSGGWKSAYTAMPGVPSMSAYVMWLFAKLATLLGIEGGSMALGITMRVPAVLADIIVCYFIFTIAEKYCTPRVAACYSMVYALIPVFFTFSSVYGSYLTLAMPFIVAMVAVILNDGKWSGVIAGVLYTVALTFSNWVLLLLPLIALYQIALIVKDKRNILPIVIQVVLCFFAIYLISLPMSLAEIKNKNVFYAFKQMYAYFRQYAFMSNDAFNLYAMFGQGNKGITNKGLEVCTWLFVIAMAAVMFVNYFANGKNRLDTVLLSAVSVIAFAALGTGITVEVMTLGLLLLLIYIIIVPDVRLFAVFGTLSLTHFLNIAQLAARSGYINSDKDMEYLMFPALSPFVIIFSIVTVVAAFALIYIALDICYYNREYPLTPLRRSVKDQLAADAKFSWVKDLIEKRKNSKVSK